MIVQRRNILAVGGALLAGSAETVAQQGAGSRPRHPSHVPARNAGPVEVVCKAPHGQPNGLAQGPNPGELWVQDRGIGRYVTLIHASDGSVIREITADAIGPSGVTMDDDGVMWTSDTHGVMLVSFDAQDGHTIAKYFVPGACRMYERSGDAPRRVSKLKLAYPDERRQMGDNLPHNEGNDTGSGLGPGRVPPDTSHFWSATGPAGIIAKGNLLIYSCLPARAIFTIDKRDWTVQDVWPTPGARALGLCWADGARSSFWCAEANLNALYRFEIGSGAIVERIQLPEDSPVLHGCQIVGNHMYFTDDMGWICRFQM
jgi:streptogramin lyase